MKVWIDQDLCTADGLCEEIAPDVFVMDLEGLTDGTFPPQPAKLGSLATGVTQVREHVVRPPLTQNPQPPFAEGVRTYERGAGVALPVASSPRIQRVAGE